MKVEIFTANMLGFKRAAQDYKKWVENNPDIEVVSTVAKDDTIVVTYKLDNSY